MRPAGEEKLFSMLGLCERARVLVKGTNLICTELRRKQGESVAAVVEASDTSENTHKRLVSKCCYYGVPHYRVVFFWFRLAHAVGKTGAVAAVAVTDPNLYKALLPYLPEKTEETQLGCPASEQEENP
jgi:ribosomal protein L7Ae-like RNA K-turn-binding protein